MTSVAGLTERAGAAFEDYRAGDWQRMADLVDLLSPLLWQVARSARLDREQAEDVVQNAWLQLLQHADRIESPQAVVAWLATTVRRESWRVAKASGRLIPRGDDDTLGETDVVGAATRPPDPADVVATSDRDTCLWRHVMELSPRCRALLRVVSHADAPDYAALSEALGMPIGSIGPTRGRCLAKLRTALLNDPTWSTE